MIYRTLALVRRALSGHTTVAAYLALLLASSTAAYAAATIGSANVINNSLQSVDLKDGAAVGGIDVINDSLKGADIDELSLNGAARKIIWDVQASAEPPRTTLVSLAGFTLTADCISPFGDHAFVRLWVRGPAGDFQLAMVNTLDDDIATLTPVTGGHVLPANTDVLVRDGFFRSVESHFNRYTGTLMLHSGTTLVQVDLHMLADARTTPACLVYGTATRAI